MVSSFHGLETARRALSIQRSALHTTAHNIANASTPGYSRQRVSLKTSEPYPGAGLNRPHIPGQIGTGVEAGTVERIRESYLDIQFRMEHTKLGYYESLSAALAKMEDIMNEPSDSGLQTVMNQFWNALQDLANHPENLGARQVAASRGEMVADTFNYYYNSLERIKRDLGSEIDVTVKRINDIIKQIHDINMQIAKVEPHGLSPNDLYDERDLLVDELSKYVNVRVNAIIPEQYGLPVTSAVGLYEIEIIRSDGSSYGDGAKLLSVDGGNGSMTVQTLIVTGDNDEDAPLEGNVRTIRVGEFAIEDLGFSGELAGLIESYGYVSGQAEDGRDIVEGYFPEMMEKLNKLAFAFVSEFNYIHSQGYDLNGESGEAFFELGEEASYEYNPDLPYAQLIRMNYDIIQDPAKIAAASESEDSAGDNTNAFRLANIKAKDFRDYEFIKPGEEGGAGGTLPGDMTGSFDYYYAAMIGDLGVDAQSAVRNRDNDRVLVDSVEFNRQSVSGVSLDEEMTNMIMFQHAYNASARMITVIDEMLDRIINGMGITGR